MKTQKEHVWPHMRVSWRRLLKKTSENRPLPWLVVSILLLLVSAPRSSSAKENSGPANRLAVALLGFENRTGDPLQEHWKYGFNRLLDDSLREVRSIRRSPGVLYGLKDVGLKEGDTIAAADARKIGEIIEARRVIWGDYQRQDKKWLVKARVMNVASGEVSRELTAAGDDWFEIRDTLLLQILSELNVHLTKTERRKALRHFTSSTLALEWFSKAIASDWQAASFGQTEQELRRALAADPHCAEIYADIATSLAAQGRMEEAEKMARTSVKLRPDYAGARSILGWILGHEEKYHEAQQECFECSQLDPDDAGAFEMLGAIAEQQNDPVMALVNLRRAVQLDPFAAEQHAHIGSFFAKQAQSEKALAELKEAERLETKDALNTEQFLCLGYSRLRDAPSTAEHCKILLALAKKTALDPTYATYFEKLLSECQSRMAPVYVSFPRPKDYSGPALTNYLKTKLTAEELAAVVNPLAGNTEMDKWARELTSGATNELQKAQMLFDKLSRRIYPATSSKARTAQEAFAVWNNPKESLWCRDYANLYVALARVAGLNAYWVYVSETCDGQKGLHACAGVYIGNKLLLVDPSYCWFGVPQKKFSVLNDPQAIAMHLTEMNGLMPCRIASKLAPEFPIIQQNLFSVLIEQNRWTEASQVMAKIIQMEPDGMAAGASRGAWAIHEGKPDEAIGFLQKAIQSDPSQGNLYTALAGAYIEEGKLEQARDCLRKGLKCALTPRNANKARQAIAKINETIGTDSKDD